MGDIFYFLVIFGILYLLANLPYIIKYLRSGYREESGVNIITYLMDKGAFGEALTFMELEKVKGHHRILTNLYLPTEDGTTEVDVVFINRSESLCLRVKTIVVGSLEVNDLETGLVLSTSRNISSLIPSGKIISMLSI